MLAGVEVQDAGVVSMRLCHKKMLILIGNAFLVGTLNTTTPCTETGRTGACTVSRPLLKKSLCELKNQFECMVRNTELRCEHVFGGKHYRTSSDTQTIV